MFSFFKKKKSIQKKDIETILNLYIQDIKNYTWDEYCQLDKYEKLFAFSVKEINDITLIENIRNTYFNPDNPYNKGKLPDEAKRKIKKLGIYLKDISSLKTNHNCIIRNLRQYSNLGKLPLSKHIRIVIEDQKEKSNMISFAFHCDNINEFSGIIPPNYPSDPSTFMYIRKQDFNRFNIEKEIDKAPKIKIHPDYDFNIPKYIIDKYS